MFRNENNIPYYVIGNGSNLLVKDGGIRGVVITLTKLDKIQSKGNLIKAEAGVLLKDDSERADDVAKKNRSDIYKGSSQVRRRSNRYEFKTPQTNFLFGRCISCMTLIPLLV